MNKEKETSKMRKTFITIAAAAVLASSSAWAGTTICQPLGDATVCTDGTTAMPLGDGVYIDRTPRNKWGTRVPAGHDEHEIRERK